eukprot:CAMPEP_0202962282 /NCGR_PEP_ID=MMETSP1396-20130829/6377_1 /ASSEMBLY_ACC=CAM_ASM_000872 /TAXON_ID= /ORGANISM="Pseudokeronopsis sp., Strain Brazil" /LENGTH=72 /DNA_ID=CAMNT_0049682735 /DNA_START=169 /DNA_END=387 /DNA_ORIENTATION=-
MILPNQSWVARWNNLTKQVPGIYAVSLLGQHDEVMRDEEREYDEEEEEEDPFEEEKVDEGKRKLLKRQDQQP